MLSVPVLNPIRISVNSICQSVFSSGCVWAYVRVCVRVCVRPDLFAYTSQGRDKEWAYTQLCDL